MNKKLSKYLIAAIIVSVIIYFTLNILDYFDPLSLCYVSIERDLLRGNRDTIKAAIKLLKIKDKEGYKIFCKYTDRVREGLCADSTQPSQYYDACYIKGSKTIYLKPEKDNTEFIVASRAAALKKYSAYSREFWENFKK